MSSIWLVAAQVVAVIGLLIHVLQLLVLLLHGYTDIETLHQDTTPERKNGKAGEWLHLILVNVVAIVAVLIELMADIKLLLATKFELDCSEALKKVRYWQNAALVFSVLSFVVYIMRFSIISFLVTFIFRVGSVFVAYKLTQELKSYKNSPSEESQENLP